MSRLEFINETMHTLVNDLRAMARSMMDLACEVIFDDTQLQMLQGQMDKDVNEYQKKVEDMITHISKEEYTKLAVISAANIKKPVTENMSKGTGHYRVDFSPDTLLLDAQPLEVRHLLTKFRNWVTSGHPDGTNIDS